MQSLDLEYRFTRTEKFKRIQDNRNNASLNMYKKIDQNTSQITRSYREIDLIMVEAINQGQYQLMSPELILTNYG